jgi:beta-1,4-N-acetylglucosaminyltransferase
VASIARTVPQGTIRRQIALIFLTVGNWYKGFDRLVEGVDNLIRHGIIQEHVVAQIGYGAYRPTVMRVVDFCSPSDFRTLIAESRLVISHAGVGTIMEAVAQCRPIIVVPRRSALGEVSNDHQLTTARQLEAERKVLVAYEVADIPGKLAEAENFVPVRGDSGKEIIRAVREFIEKVQAHKRDSIQHE